jgi:hypothetical protein
MDSKTGKGCLSINAFPLNFKRILAEELDMTRQNFNYHWSSARGQLILDYIEYFKSLISKYT